MPTKEELFSEALEIAKKCGAYREKFERNEATEVDAIQAKTDRKKLNDFIEYWYQEGVFDQEDVSLLYGAATGVMVEDFSLFLATKEGKSHPTIDFVREQSKKLEDEELKKEGGGYKLYILPLPKL